MLQFLSANLTGAQSAFQVTIGSAKAYLEDMERQIRVGEIALPAETREVFLQSIADAKERLARACRGGSHLETIAEEARRTIRQSEER